MVQFLGVAGLAGLIRLHGLPKVYRGLIATMEEDFLRWEKFDKVARVASHSPDGVIELMPASDDRLYAFKYVNGHPLNTREGLQTVTAFGLLADVATGYPMFLSEMTLATAVRTAAASAMAAKVLARTNSRCMALIGLGAQAEFQAHAIAEILGICELHVFDIDPLAVAKFMANMRHSRLRITPAASAEAAVAGADIITTVTADKRNATILSDNMVGAGVHLNAVGGDCPGKTELQREILLRANIFVEFAPQTRIEGEIQQLPGDAPVTELWEVMSGRRPGRQNDRQITLFDSVGFAIEDFSALRFFYELSKNTEFVSEIDLLAEPEDPKNLFGLIAGWEAAPKDSKLLSA